MGNSQRTLMAVRFIVEHAYRIKIKPYLKKSDTYDWKTQLRTIKYS